MQNQTFPSVKQTHSQVLSQAETQAKPAGAVRWIVSFSFFLALFATLALLISYGIISLRSAEKPTATTTASATAATASGPAATSSPNAQSEAGTLPSGTAGHAGNPAGSHK